MHFCVFAQVGGEGGFGLDSSDSSSRLSHTHTHQPTVTFLSSISKVCSILFSLLSQACCQQEYWRRSPLIGAFGLGPVDFPRCWCWWPWCWCAVLSSSCNTGHHQRGVGGDPTRFYSDTIPSNSNHPVPVRLLFHFVVIAFQISYQRFASRPPICTI